MVGMQVHSDYQSNSTWEKKVHFQPPVNSLGGKAKPLKKAKAGEKVELEEDVMQHISHFSRKHSRKNKKRKKMTLKK